MSTKVRSNLAKSNPYYIPHYRFLELKYFCLQYPDWVKERDDLLQESFPKIIYEKKEIQHVQNEGSIVEDIAIKRAELDKKIKLVEETVMETDKEFATFLLIAVTTDKTYPYLNAKLGLPLSRTSFYDRYRRFYYLLSKRRN